MRGIYSGCHQSTCYGAAPLSISSGPAAASAGQYHGYMSWSSDGTVRLWSENCALRGPSSFSSSVTLRVPTSDPACPFPVYGAAARWFPPTAACPEEKLLIAIAGGSSGMQFVGCPVHVINLAKSLAAAGGV